MAFSGGSAHESPSSGKAVFFLGNRSFRTWGTVRGILVRITVSAVAFLLVAAGSLSQPPLATYLLAIPLTGGAVALATAAGLLAAFGMARIDPVVISHRGVKCGDRLWGWERVRAFRARRTRPSGAIRLFFWTGLDKGRGRSLAVDEPVTPEQALSLIGRVGEFCSENGFNVTCETSC